MQRSVTEGQTYSMLCNIYRVYSAFFLCRLICNCSCNNLNVERQLSELRERFEARIQEVEKDIPSINDAVTKLVFMLIQEEPTNQEQELKVKKREVVASSNPLTNLPLSKLAGLRGPPGKDGRDGKDGVGGGAVYTRWGRTTCGSDSTLLYSGYAGGSNHNHPGGGTNYQCMPLDPKYNRFSATHLGVSFMAGVEYQTNKNGIFMNSAHDQNAPCARCYTNDRSAVMMIPAKRDCSEGWTKEYEGYLMTEHEDHNHQTTFECVDQSPEYVTGEEANDNGALFYFVRTYCSSGGHCPPYDSNKEMTCVVCSK